MQTKIAWRQSNLHKVRDHLVHFWRLDNKDKTQSDILSPRNLNRKFGLHSPKKESSDFKKIWLAMCSPKALVGHGSPNMNLTQHW